MRGPDAVWKQLAERLQEAGPAAKVSIEVQDDGRVKLNVDRYYLRAGTIATANARLIEVQADVPVVKFWGEDLLASVDGLRFVVPGSPRDSPHILDRLLNLDGGVKPEMVATDNAPYPDMVFASRWLPPAAGPARPDHLSALLNEIGVPAAAARGAAIRQQLRDMPAPVVADALGHHHKTTTRLRNDTGGTWSRYGPGDPGRSPAGWAPRGTGDS